MQVMLSFMSWLHKSLISKLNILQMFAKPRARICRPFKEPRNRFQAWPNRFLESIPGLHKRLVKWSHFC
jgi:hypothetical protein